MQLWNVETKHKMHKEDQTLMVPFMLETTTLQIQIASFRLQIMPRDSKMMEDQGEDVLRTRDVVVKEITTGIIKVVMVETDQGGKELDSKVREEAMMVIVKKIATQVGKEEDSREGRKEDQREGKIEGKMQGKKEAWREMRKERMLSPTK